MRNVVKRGWGVLGVAGAGILGFGLVPGLEAYGVYVGVLFLAVVFWFAEVLPLHVTGLLLAAIIVVLGDVPTQEVFGSFFDPTIVILFGGFVLAILLQEYGLDRDLVRLLLRKESYRPGVLLILVMGVSAFLSMWISNTAAAALMIPLVMHLVPGIATDPKKRNYCIALVLGCAYACTVGGIATLVGSPPNFLAVSTLNDLGYEFGFIEWMVYALPFTVLLLGVVWMLLQIVFPSGLDRVHLTHHEDSEENTGIDLKKMMVGGIFIVTVIGWLTTTFTGLSSAVVALFPILLGSMLGVLPDDYLKKVDRSILLLIGGGIVLGNALYVSGTAQMIADGFMGLAGEWSLRLLLLGVGVLGVLLTMFASNTASAALLLPLIAPIGAQMGIEVMMVIFVGIAVSLDFTAPMGTPPNAIAYSTGLVSIRTMAKVGLILSVLSVMILFLVTETLR